MLTGIEVPRAGRELLMSHLQALGYPYTEETANLAIAVSWPRERDGCGWGQGGLDAAPAGAPFRNEMGAPAGLPSRTGDRPSLADFPVARLDGLRGGLQLLVDQLPEDWPLVALDWPGYGQSERHEQHYWFPEHLAELDWLLNEISPHQPAQIVGHSMGGTVASMYAGVRPERVAWLVNMEGIGMPELPAVSCRP